MSKLFLRYKNCIKIDQTNELITLWNPLEDQKECVEDEIWPAVSSLGSHALNVSEGTCSNFFTVSRALCVQRHIFVFLSTVVPELRGAFPALWEEALAGGRDIGDTDRGRAFKQPSVPLLKF